MEEKCLSYLCWRITEMISEVFMVILEQDNKKDWKDAGIKYIKNDWNTNLHIGGGWLRARARGLQQAGDLFISTSWSLSHFNVIYNNFLKTYWLLLDLTTWVVWSDAKMNSTVALLRFFLQYGCRCDANVLCHHVVLWRLESGKDKGSGKTCLWQTEKIVYIHTPWFVGSVVIWYIYQV